MGSTHWAPDGRQHIIYLGRCGIGRQRYVDVFSSLHIVRVVPCRDADREVVFGEKTHKKRYHLHAGK